MKRTFLITLAAILALTMSSCKANEPPEDTAEPAEASTKATIAAEQTDSPEEQPETTAVTEQTEATTETTSDSVPAKPTFETVPETNIWDIPDSPVTGTSADAPGVCTCKNEWQHAYCEYLNKLDYLAGGVYLGDINGDDIPEAVIEINPFEMTDILYFNDDGMQVLKLETTSVWGSVRYLKDTKQILFEPMYGHTQGTWGYTEYYIYGWNGSDYEVTSTLFRESGMYSVDDDGTEHTEYGKAYIDGKEVDNETFEERLAATELLKQANSYFPVAYIQDRDMKQNPDLTELYQYFKENFPCFNNWDIIQY